MSTDTSILQFILAAKDNASATVRKVNTEINQLGPTASKASGPLGTLGAVTGGLVSPTTLAVGALTAAGFAMGASIRAASDLNEEIAKSEQVFGPAAAEIRSFAEGAADIGLSERAALGAAGAFGNMFNTVGLAQGASADMSETMVRLAADMASFNNQDPSEMLDKLRSGLAGEAEPLRRFGVLLSEAAVKTQAYKTGLAEAGAELTEAQKVQARYSLILEQTATQQGDVERTSGSLANAERKLAAEIENLGAKIGEFMQGPGATLISWLAAAVEGAGRAASAIGELWRTITFGTPTVDELNSEFEDAFGFALPNTVAEGGEAIDEELSSWTPMVTGTLRQSFVAPFAAEMRSIRENARAEMGALPADVGEAMIDNMPTLRDSLRELREMIKHELDPQTRIHRLQGMLNSKVLADGMKSEDPYVRARTREIKDGIRDEISKLKTLLPGDGEDAIRGFGEGMNRRKREIGKTAQDLARGVRNNLEFDASAAGESVADTWISGMATGIRAGASVISSAILEMKANSIGNSLPRGGPLSASRLEEGARSIAQHWSRSFANALAAGSALVGGGLSAPTGGLALAGGGGGGLVVHFNSTFPPKPSDAEELARQLWPAWERERKRQQPGIN